MPQYPQVMTQKKAAHLWHINVAAPPETNPPVNIDVPYVTLLTDMGGIGNIYHCTVGTWENMGDLVDTYAFRWQRNGAPITVGANIEDYTAVAADVTTTLTCIVSATNTIGTTAAPPSNGMIVP
jgi:hypothetical protein